MREDKTEEKDEYDKTKKWSKWKVNLKAKDNVKTTSVRHSSCRSSMLLVSSYSTYTC